MLLNPCCSGSVVGYVDLTSEAWKLCFGARTPVVGAEEEPRFWPMCVEIGQQLDLERRLQRCSEVH